VTQKGFEGCIKDIQLGSTRKNINEHIEAKDILPGCPEVCMLAALLKSDHLSMSCIIDSETSLAYILLFAVYTVNSTMCLHGLKISTSLLCHF